VSDIRDTLAQLDRRLSDLKREIASIGDEGQSSAAGSPPARSVAYDAAAARARMGEPDVPSSVPAFAPPPLPRVGEPARAAEPTASAPAAMTAAPAAPRTAAPPSAAADAFAPHEIVAKAEAEAARLLAHAHERVDDLKAQIEQLLGVRDRLLSSAKDLVRQYEEEVTQLELTYPASSAESEIGSVPPSQAPPASEPPASHAAFEAPPPEPPPRPALFDGVVTITVPWISRIQTIQVLEDSLFRVRGAHKAYVRGYHQGEVRFELELGEAVDLIGELNRALPYAFAIESASQDEIVIRLERGEGSGGRGVQ
jgi:hypothetical protein